MISKSEAKTCFAWCGVLVEHADDLGLRGLTTIHDVACYP